MAKKNRRRKNKSKIGKVSIEEKDSKARTYSGGEELESKCLNIPTNNSPGKFEQVARAESINYVTQYHSNIERNIQPYDSEIEGDRNEIDNCDSDEKCTNALDSANDSLPNKVKEKLDSDFAIPSNINAIKRQNENEKVNKQLWESNQLGESEWSCDADSESESGVLYGKSLPDQFIKNYNIKRDEFSDSDFSYTNLKNNKKMKEKYQKKEDEWSYDEDLKNEFGISFHNNSQEELKNNYYDENSNSERENLSDPQFEVHFNMHDTIPQSESMSINYCEENLICNEKPTNAALSNNSLPDEFKKNVGSELKLLPNSEFKFQSNIDSIIQQSKKVSKEGCVKHIDWSGGQDSINSAFPMNKAIPDGSNRNLLSELEEITDSYSDFYAIVDENIREYEALRNIYLRRETRWNCGNSAANTSNLFNNYFPNEFKRNLFSMSTMSDSEFHSIIDNNKHRYETMKNTRIRAEFKKHSHEEVTYTANSLDGNSLEEFKNIFLTESPKLEFCSDMIERIRNFENSIKSFHVEYCKWKRERKNTLSKLEELVQKVHDDQLAYNKANLLFKKANTASRLVKQVSYSSIASFIATCGAFATDAIGGISSAFQAINSDSHMTTFSKLIENDIRLTKLLYVKRSKCFPTYNDVEVINRSYHSDNFESTVKNIYQSLTTKDANTYEQTSRGNMLVEYVDGVDDYFRQAPVGQVCESVKSYMESNPAAQEACECAGRAIYDLYDTWSQIGVARATRALVPSSLINDVLTHRNFQEIGRLSNLVENEDEPQVRLESKIHEAIEDLGAELREVDVSYVISKRFEKGFGELRNRLEDVETELKVKLKELRKELKNGLEGFRNRLEAIRNKLAKIREMKRLNVKLRISLADLRSLVFLRYSVILIIFLAAFLF